MAVTLIGTIINSADTVDGYNVGNISGDDDFVEGTGAIGVKNSAATTEMYTTNIGSGPYDYSGTGGNSGEHIIMWFNTKSPLNATAGFRIVVGNGTDRGHWNVVPAGFYKGGFLTRVIDSARAFDSIAAGGWTLGGNPGQLTSVTEVGGVHQTPASIMGNFNNFQIDQFVTGLGVRVDAGSSGTPNTFETVRAADEDTNFWGWWSSAHGAFVGKGKLFIGPATGSTTSVFDDTAFTVIFANEKVASNFYEINIRGGGTDVSWDLGSISAAAPSTVRWRLNVDSTTNSFSDTNGVWTGAGSLVLNSNSTLTGTSIINCTSLTQNSATLDSCSILDANTTSGTAFITSNNPANISDSDFTFSAGHAIEITQTGTYTFTGNTFSGYGVDGSNDAAIYNNSGGSVTLNITGGGDSPTVRNGSGASTTINNNINLTVKIQNQAGNAIPGVEVAVFQDNSARTVVLSSTPTDENGEVTTSVAASLGDIIIRARQSTNIATFVTDTGVDGGTEVITTDANHNFQDGDPVVYSKDGGTESVGLTEGTTYYVNNITTTTLSLHTTAANAIADTSRVDLTAGATSETHQLDPVRYFPASTTGTIGSTDFSAQITMVTDTIATG